MNTENKKRRPATLGGIDLDKLNHEIVTMNNFKGQGKAEGIFIPFSHFNPCLVVTQKEDGAPLQVRMDVELIELENKLSRWMLKANVRSANKKAYGIDTKEKTAEVQPIIGYLREFDRNDQPQQAPAQNPQPAPHYDDDDLPPDDMPSPADRYKAAPAALTGDFSQEAPDWTTDL